MKLLIEFVSFNIYYFFIWDTAGYATTRSPRRQPRYNNKRRSGAERESSKVNIQIQSFISAWNSYENLPQHPEKQIGSDCFGFDFIHHHHENGAREEKKCQWHVFQFLSRYTTRHTEKKYYLLRKLPWYIGALRCVPSPARKKIAEALMSINNWHAAR